MTANERSLYRGVRLTMTVSPDGQTLVTSVCTKEINAHWADWSSLFPATIERADKPVESLREALERVHTFIGEVLEAYE